MKISLIFLIVILVSSCAKEPKLDFLSEPEDPDETDMSVWEKTAPGVHSAFGSLDIPYSKSQLPTDQVYESLKLSGWKGERVAFLLLVWTAGNDEEVSIEVQGLVNGDARIEKTQFTVSVLGYVLTDQFLNENGSACGPRDSDKIPVHLAPDKLIAGSRFLLRGPSTRPVWIAIDIPADASPGTYQGAITRKSRSEAVSHPFTLEVQDMVLPPPGQWAFHLDLWQNPFAVARYHGVPLWSEEHLALLRAILTKLAMAGQKAITTTILDRPWDGQTGFDPYGSMVEWVRKSNGSWSFGFANFDTYVELAMDCGISGQISCFSMIPINNKLSWYDESTAERVVFEALPGTAEYEEIWGAFLQAFRAHLKGKGWLEMTYLALDERAEEDMMKLFEFLETNAPDLKVTMAGFYHESVNSYIDDFSSNWRDEGRIPEDAIAARRQAGLKTTYYVACGIPQPNNFTFSPPSESAYQGWIAAAMGFDGFLRWANNSWPENPMVDSRFVRWPAGDTYLMYPGAISSVRFERLREGIQDYEKIRILQASISEDSSEGANAALADFQTFLDEIGSRSLYKKPAADWLAEGKRRLYELERRLL
ncbi:Neuraminidase NanP [Lunatimonas lonarensis]|uniref:Neuraminidase NanP n=1 Tax=Lunatimonas lonarensis TaxID=1232681 RepID=R7ZYC7_9BACT|nr:DUF4091 domain-containing protein [Lunatimonas lonarensis]EON79073.1 Neuraminidase NanP [Lunatimonas lonarensis]